MYCGGVLLFGLLALKEYLLPPLAHPAVLNTTCYIGASALFTATLFICLRSFFTETTRRRIYFLCSLCTGGLLLVLLLTNFYEYLFINRTLIKFESEPDLLPRLVELEQRTTSPDQQDLAARLTYEISGVRLAYNRNSSGWIYYMPSKDEVKIRQETEQINLAVANLRRTSQGFLYGMVDIALTIFLTFVVALSWSAFCKLEVTQTSSPSIESEKI